MFMKDYDYIINCYQGKGVPYYGRRDDIRMIVLNICRHMYYNDTDIVQSLISHYKDFRYIKDIRIEGYTCIIEYDEGIVSFNVFPSSFYQSFCDDIFGISDTYGQCHYVTQKILENCHCDNISAVTSLCINTNYIVFFHSYNLDRRENKVIDFARKFSMDKDQYDMLFCYRQINDLNYYEYKNKLANSDYDVNSNVCPLLYLCLYDLDEENKKSSNVKVKYMKR